MGAITDILFAAFIPSCIRSRACSELDIVRRTRVEVPRGVVASSRRRCHPSSVQSLPGFDGYRPPPDDVEGLGGGAQPCQEAGQSLGDSEIGLPVLGTIDGRLQLAMQRLLLTAELRRSVAQLVDCD